MRGRDHDVDGEPWTTAHLHRSAEPGPDSDPVADPGAADLVGALNRVAEAFERVADGLDADRRDRKDRRDDLDGVLRGLVAALQSPTAVAPVVVAGSIDLSEPEAEIEADA